jgi:hypothetical protein
MVMKQTIRNPRLERRAIRAANKVFRQPFYSTEHGRDVMDAMNIIVWTIAVALLINFTAKLWSD